MHLTAFTTLGCRVYYNVSLLQLDYILMKHRFRNSIINAKACPGADADSDHNFTVADVNIKLKLTLQRWNKQKIKEDALFTIMLKEGTDENRKKHQKEQD